MAWCIPKPLVPQLYILRRLPCLYHCVNYWRSPCSHKGAFLLLQGLENLSLRMERHCSNALALAEYLEQSPKIKLVNYAAYPTAAIHAMSEKYRRQSSGFIVLASKRNPPSKENRRVGQFYRRSTNCTAA